MQDDERAQMGRQHIFVVNGSPDFLDVARELLQEEHYNVTTTNFVPQSFDQIAALNPALVILDLAVGVRAGGGLLERPAPAARLRDIPTIVVSTNPRYLKSVQADPAGSGAPRVLRKPFDLDDLLRAVDQLIGPA